MLYLNILLDYIVYQQITPRYLKLQGIFILLGKYKMIIYQHKKTTKLFLVLIKKNNKHILHFKKLLFFL